MRGIRYVYIDRKCLLWVERNNLRKSISAMIVSWSGLFRSVFNAEMKAASFSTSILVGSTCTQLGKLSFKPIHCSQLLLSPIHTLCPACVTKNGRIKKLAALTFKFRTLLVVMIIVMVLIMDSFMGLVGGLEGEPAKSQKSRFVSKFKSGSTHPTQGQLKITCIESISDVSNQL